MLICIQQDGEPVEIVQKSRFNFNVTGRQDAQGNPMGGRLEQLFYGTFVILFLLFLISILLYPLCKFQFSVTFDEVLTCSSLLFFSCIKGSAERSENSGRIQLPASAAAELADGPPQRQLRQGLHRRCADVPHSQFHLRRRRSR